MTTKKKLAKEVMEELKAVLSGKTFDALIPPLIFTIVNSLYGLNTAALSAIIVALSLSCIRLVLKQKSVYAFGGLLGVLIASGFAFIAGNASNYFIPGIINSGFFIAITFISLILKKPLAAWVSHLSRGWELEWFWRKDVKKAYSEVTWFWLVFFVVRMVLQINLLLNGDVTRLLWANSLLGMPVTLGVLIVSYIYGIKRLHQLGGPGIDEFRLGKEKPWNGQTRGF